MFPHLVKALTSEQLGALVATTRLVGMEQPGLHSMFGSLEADLSVPTDDRDFEWA